MSLDSSRIAAAFRALADAFEDQPLPGAAPAAVATPAPRGRGRPPKGGAAPATAAAAPAEAAAEPDPFAEAPPAAPAATIDEVRAALTALKTATTQENALAVLKSAGGADNLTSLKPEKYGAVVAAAKLAVAPVKAAPAVEDDPFALPAAAAEKPITKEELKALIVDAQKRTSADTVQKLVMEHGGKAKNPDSGIEGPNFNALPAEKYSAVAAKLKALPSTK